MIRADTVKGETCLREFAERAAGLSWDSMKSDARRGDWWAPCPFHAEETASFHVVEPGGRGGRWYCFGCQEGGTALDFAMRLEGLDLKGAIDRLARFGGIEEELSPAERERREAERRAKLAEKRAREAEAERKAWDRARAIWEAAEPDAPLLRAYLEARGIDTARLRALTGFAIPPSLRLAPSLPHWRSGGGGPADFEGPAMVAFVGRGGFYGVHRTWITEEGRARFPDGEKVAKQLLGRPGWLYGSPVLLSPRPLRETARAVIVGEGIETALAGFCLLGRGGVAAEASISRGPLAGPGDRSGEGPELGANGRPLPSPLPEFPTDNPGWLPGLGVEFVHILGDPSVKCAGTAERLGQRTRAKLEARGYRARLYVPGGDWGGGQDFADLALEARRAMKSGG